MKKKVPDRSEGAARFFCKEQPQKDDYKTQRRMLYLY